MVKLSSEIILAMLLTAFSLFSFYFGKTGPFNWIEKIIIPLIVIFIFILTAYLNVSSYKENIQLEKRADDLSKQVNSISSRTKNMDKNIAKILTKTNPPIHKWITVEKPLNIPPMVPYVFLVFKANPGVITGNVKILGTETIYPFSTEVNDQNPIAIKIPLNEKRTSKLGPVKIQYEIVESMPPGNVENKFEIAIAGLKLPSGFAGSK